MIIIKHFINICLERSDILDRRVKYTKNIIKSTFLNLLKEKDIKKISVSEICTIADINRATFYRYYLDIYDLLDKIQENFINELKDIFMDDLFTFDNITHRYLNACLKNKELVRVLFNTYNNFYFLSEVFDIINERCFDKWNNIKNVKDSDIEECLIFIINGSIGIINYWVKEDFKKDIDEVSNIIIKLSNASVIKYIYKE